MLQGKPDNGYKGDPFQGSPSKHFSSKQYIRHYGQSMWDQYFTFAFVRNPWDRIVSWTRYRDLRHSRPGGVTADKIKQDMEKRFIQNSSYHKMLFQRGKPIVNMIGRFETLQQDIDQVFDTLGLPQKQAPHLNKSAITEQKPYWEYYDQEAQELVGEVFRKDIKYFNYKFGE